MSVNSCIARGGVVALTFALAGCATNAIRVERAGTMIEAGRVATDKTSALMEDVRRENRTFLVDLVASDPNCTLPTPRIANLTDRRPGLCAAGGSGGDFSVPRITRQDFGPSLAVIDGLTAYLDVVDAVVQRDALDLAKVVFDAESQLRSFVGDVETVAGTSQNPFLPPALTSDQTNAVRGTLDLLSGIIDQAERVKDLRRIELDPGSHAFKDNVDRLHRINRRWVLQMYGQLMNRRAVVARRLAKIPTRLYDQRRLVAEQQMLIIERLEDLPAFEQGLIKATKALGEAHANYIDLLYNPRAPLTLAERRLKAKIERERIRGALRSLASLVAAF